MKVHQLIFTALTLFFLTITTQAQNFEIPENYTLKTEDDYKKYEQDVINGINWTENTPLNQQVAKRKDVNAFLMQWMTGTPTITIGVSAYVVEVSEKNPDLLMIFLGGWVKHAMENSEELSEMEGNLAGMKSVLKVYENNKVSGIKKEKTLEKLLKMKSDEDLEKWIKKKLKN